MFLSPFFPPLSSSALKHLVTVLLNVSCTVFVIPLCFQKGVKSRGAKNNVCEDVITVNNLSMGRLSEGEVFFPFFLGMLALIIDRTTLS